jgi:hypothetical protein
MAGFADDHRTTFILIEMRTIRVNRKDQECFVFEENGADYHAVKRYFKIIEEGDASGFFSRRKPMQKQKEELTTEIHALLGESSIGVLPDGSGGYSRKIQIRNIKPKEAYSYSFVDVRFSKKLAA